MNTTSTERPGPDAPLYEFDTATGALLQTHLPLPRRAGKVRDVYDLGDSLLIVSSDRISAFDWILPSGIPGKGVLLTRMSQFWFDRLDVPNHLIDVEVPDSLAERFDTTPLEGRVMVVRKAEVVPFECVVRGYLEGSGLREYNATGTICDVDLPAGLLQCDVLPSPIFTPATKAEQGHDQNVSFGQMIEAVGQDEADRLREMSLRIYQAASDYAATQGILIADTKFEFGRVDGRLILIDEVLTPDSSRFWDAGEYRPGQSQPSFDKQFVREWLSESDWERDSPPPPLPEEIVRRTAAKYDEALRRIVGD